MKSAAFVLPVPGAPRSRADRYLRRQLLSAFSRLEHGTLTLIDGEQVWHFSGSAAQDGAPHATLTIHDPNAYWRIALRGSVGAAESFIHGEWETDDLTTLIRLFARNTAMDAALDSPWAWVGRQLLGLYHARRRNTREGSRENIAAHYDLGNDFYRLFLDDTLMYSCAVFPDERTDLKSASLAKLDRICRKLALQPTDHVLEIGTGWGGFAIYAASHYGCRVTTTTISQAQYDYACQRVQQAGLQDQITVLLKDYRDLDGQFDKVVSIEMIEAVGHQYLGAFFAQCQARLRPDGQLFIQAITIADQFYAESLKTTDFIQRYIFPGGCLPSVAALTHATAKHTDLRLIHLEDIGPHYATTLQRWRERFNAQADAVRALGFSDAFIRMWNYYFCYCEAGFLERTIGTVQLVFTRPDCRRSPILPAL